LDPGKIVLLLVLVLGLFAGTGASSLSSPMMGQLAVDNI
jgi:hypothetical protein